MFATQSFLILGLFCVGSVLSERVICDFEDSECLTKTARLTFKQFIDGMPGVQSSDPLYQKLIEVKLPALYYKLTEAELAGLKNCEEELIKISAKDLKYDYRLGCPHVTISGRYVITGELGPHHVEGKGDCKIDFYDYHFLLHGDYVTKKGKKGYTHINLKNHTLVLQAKGKVVYELKNLFDGDTKKSDAVHKFINDNYIAVHNGAAQKTMNAFMDNYIDNANDYLGKVSVQELFSYEK